jgi:hypothetical protein
MVFQGIPLALHTGTAWEHLPQELGRLRTPMAGGGLEEQTGLEAAGTLKSPAWRAAVEAVPRELFLHLGVLMPAEGGHWRPVTGLGADPKAWLETAYSDQSLATQFDGHLTADQVVGFVTGVPTSPTPLRKGQ